MDTIDSERLQQIGLEAVDVLEPLFTRHQLRVVDIMIVMATVLASFTLAGMEPNA